MFERFTWELRATLLGNDARDTGITHIRPHGWLPNSPPHPTPRKQKSNPLATSVTRGLAVVYRPYLVALTRSVPALIEPLAITSTSAKFM